MNQPAYPPGPPGAVVPGAPAPGYQPQQAPAGGFDYTAYGLAPLDPQAAGAALADLQNRGAGRMGGDFPDITRYEWRKASEADHKHNPQAGMNLLWFLPKRADAPSLSVPEAVHYEKFSNKYITCMELTFPHMGVPCGFCNTLREFANVPGLPLDKLTPFWRHYFNVVDFWEPQKLAQIVRLPDRIGTKIIQRLLDTNLGESRDFTNPMAAKPWAITYLTGKNNKPKYDAAIYDMDRRPMFLGPDQCTPDMELLDRVMKSMSNLQKVILTPPKDERMAEWNLVIASVRGYLALEASKRMNPSISVPQGYAASAPTPNLPSIPTPAAPAQGYTPGYGSDLPAAPAPVASAPAPAYQPPAPPATFVPVAPASAPAYQTPASPATPAPAPAYQPPAPAPAPAHQPPAPPATPASAPAYPPQASNSPLGMPLPPPPPFPAQGAAPPSIPPSYAPPAAQNHPVPAPGVLPGVSMPTSTSPGVPAPFPGQAPAASAAPPPANGAQRPACFGDAARHDPERVFCKHCLAKSECAQAITAGTPR